MQFRRHVCRPPIVSIALPDVSEVLRGFLRWLFVGAPLVGLGLAAIAQRQLARHAADASRLLSL